MSTAELPLSLKLVDVRAEAQGVVLLELRRAEGAAALPPFEPGAHLALELPNGLLRHYSLVNDCRERERYVIGVGRKVDGRGGSSFVHRTLRSEMVLKASSPRNNFRLDTHARRHLFVAGGIGIMPVMSMIHWCEAHARPWRLVYAAGSSQRAAFHERLISYGERVQCYFGGRESNALDVRELMAGVASGEHVYCCGPAALMDAVKLHGAHLPDASLHFERFVASAPSASPEQAAAVFTVVLRRSGLSLQVPSDRSILEVIEANGIKVPFGCREGLCRTCETTVHEGEVEHRDYVLSMDERTSGRAMMICVSRARSPALVLDL